MRGSKDEQMISRHPEKKHSSRRLQNAEVVHAQTLTIIRDAVYLHFTPQQQTARYSAPHFRSHDNALMAPGECPGADKLKVKRR
jgi:hypothetical protein